jgi:hypothetical protein
MRLAFIYVQIMMDFPKCLVPRSASRGILSDLTKIFYNLTINYLAQNYPYRS